MNTAEKQEKFFDWLETPRDERKPKFRSWLAKELRVNPTTLNIWEDDRRKIEAEQARKALDKPNNPEEQEEDYDSDEWLRNSTPEADRALVEAVKKGSPGAQKIFYQLIDRLREKSEQRIEHKIDGSTIAPAVLDALEELERQGMVEIKVQPSPLLDKLCLTSGQGEEKDNKV